MVRAAVARAVGHRAEAPDEQHRVGVRLGQRGAAAHGERDVGRAQHGGVVDAVADHRHHGARRLQLLHEGQLVGRQVAADGGVDAQLGRHAARQRVAGRR